MNLGAASKQEREKSRVEPAQPDAGAVEMAAELQTLRVEREMQDRALRELQAALAHSAQRYAEFYDWLPLPCVTVRSNGEITAANHAAQQWLGGGAVDTLVGQSLGIFFNAYEAGRLAAHLEAGANGREARLASIELSLRRSEVESVPVCCSIRVTRAGGETFLHVAIIDRSEAKHAERVLEQINQQQEEFSHSISHDLRAPLVTISNYARIVLEEHAAGLDEDGRRMVQRMEGAANRMETTLKQLLHYGRLAREEVTLSPVNLAEVVADLLIEHRAAIEQAGAALQVGPELPTVRGARALLGDVFSHLLSNALKYARRDERPSVRITAEAREHVAIVRVMDNGIGIEPKHHERIFRVFERLHGYSHYPGSGVGLAIARRAMDRMNGRIWVESEFGQGSCFCLELPRA